MVLMIVVTGGPCAGKTTVLKAIAEEFGGRVLRAPEPATMLFEGNFPAPGRDLAYSEKWQYVFQNAVSSLHLNMEAAFRLMAEENGARLLVCDRGILDGAAYYPDGKQAFLEMYGLTEEGCNNRYVLVIHLESTATCNPALYGKFGNENRYESLEEAQALEMRIRDAWSNHPNWTFISGVDGIEAVKSRVIALISQFVDIEIERKFVLQEIPDVGISAAVRFDQVKQGYLTTEGSELRIRLMGNVATLTSKEWERDIPREVFERHWSATTQARVEKARYFIPYGKYTLELDIYKGDLVGLVTLECEFSSEDEASAFILPDWAELAVDVTDDPAFKNKNLALNGLPDLSTY